MQNIEKILGVVVGGFVLAVGLGFVMALPVMWCWNYLMPEVFGLEKLSWFQSWVMLVLSGLLFKTSVSSN